ncbi:MAG: universal stress protein [Candidatus Manganitrophaceae bacterium]
MQTMPKERLIRRILVPTDFSPHSERAAAYAALFAKTFGATIDLLHITEPFPYSVTDTMTIIDHGEALKTIATALLKNAQTQIEEKGVTVQGHLARGVPYQQILERCREGKIDLIVMGTHGRTGMSHLLLGSVTEKVVHLAPCPVLTVTAK